MTPKTSEQNKAKIETLVLETEKHNYDETFCFYAPINFALKGNHEYEIYILTQS